MKSRVRTLGHDPVRRAAIVAGTYVGLQTAVLPGFATSVVAPLTFDELVASAQFIVVAKIHRFLFSGMDALDDFRPAAEVRDPQIVALDVTVKKVLAINPKPITEPPAVGPMLVYIGSGAKERHLKTTPYPAVIGQEVILLLLGRHHSSSRDNKQAPIYQKANGANLADRAPIPLSKLDEVLAAALKAGFIQPTE
ncbi:hypothetical protein PMI15_02395 [Polaromonas sp. CF318]|uniref:hypothetical protein n=1 Tax=Polaromonas sp. CF318 TaxID=1144318 RepID=UPI000270DB3C|nr:hypothetical protein [Polaromonas sp. CF318]EJL83979.1 hypothetical protein PMI15_02395 [Polaromonas sp. CF318]